MPAKAKFEIIAEDKTRAAWNSALGTAKSATDKIGGMLTTAFAGFSLGSFINVGRQAIQLGDDLNKAAVKAGVTGKAISELAYAAKLADVPLDALSTALKKMQVTLSEARTGGKAQIETLHALGLEYRDLKGIGADQQFELIADRVSLLGNAEDRTRALTEIFGKAGADLAPLFEQGAEGIRKAREEAERLGYSFSDENLKKMSAADEAWKRLSASADAFANKLVVKVAPAVTKTLDDMTSGAAWERAKKFFISPIAGFDSAVDEVIAFDKGQDGTSAHRGGVGRRGGDVHRTLPPGFTDTAAAAAEAAEQKKFLDGYHDALRDMNADVDRDADASLKKDMERWQDRQDAANETFEKWKQGEKDAAVWREQQWAESARVYRDYFVDAIEDMIRTGKFQWRDFLSFMVAELAKKQIGKMIDSIISSFGNSGSSSGGLFSSIVSTIAGAYSGSGGGGAIDGKASGGPVGAGGTYLIGENGPELLTMGGAGFISPNSSLRRGGGSNVTINNHIDARGATTDLVRALPGILKANSQETEQRIVERMRRDAYGLRGG